jgi:kynureninase
MQNANIYPVTINLTDCQNFDQLDPLSHCRDSFVLPEEILYLDGNSLGAMPKALPLHLQSCLQNEWSADLVKAWNSAGWAKMSVTLGDRIAELVGAGEGQIVVCDSTSINLYKAIHAALALRPDRKTVLTLADNFPTDLYMIEGALSNRGEEFQTIRTDQDGLFDRIDQTTAVLVLSQVNYLTGETLPMLEITQAAHEVGALVIWDLSLSTGVLPLDLDACEVDFAVGCSYKYLNGGPGSPAYIYVAKRHIASITQPLCGWWSHIEPFAFASEYQPANDIRRMLSGTQPILALKAVEAGIDSYRGVSIDQVRAKSIAICELFINLVQQECTEFAIEVIGDVDRTDYGSHVSLRFDQGYGLMQALIENGVIGDFRPPDIMRFGFAPLYTGYETVWYAVQTLASCLSQRSWESLPAIQPGTVT